MSQKSETVFGSHSWRNLIVITTVIVYLYVFLEWLFIITKPSSTSMLDFNQKVEIFLFSSALISGICYLIFSIPMVVGSLPDLRDQQKMLLLQCTIIPAGILSSNILLLIDNFTYTMFKVGIVSSVGYTRGLYALAFWVFFVLSFRYIWKRVAVNNRVDKSKQRKTINIIVISTVLLSFIIPVCNNDFSYKVKRNFVNQIDEKPHIILITADGVEAASMSAYGYERDTTPRIKELTKTSLVAENAFTNSGSTPGSIFAIFTGKYPATTKVLYPPDIFKSEDAYQHLPGILRDQGYYSVQMSVPFFSDAYIFNLLDAFDEANGRGMFISSQLNAFHQYIPFDFANFLYEITNRISDRLQHIIYFKSMTDPYTLVTSKPGKFTDQKKIDNTINLIRESKQPLFIHIHMMGTHGPLFNPPDQIFSKGQEIDTQKDWSTDFYDDSILYFDKQVGQIIGELKKRDLLNNSILIISSDHGKYWMTLPRIPLIIHFPKGKYAGHIQPNVQTIDIAPTILDYLGIEIPDWMQGESLLKNNLPQRPIIGVKAPTEGVNNSISVQVKDALNVNRFGWVSLIYCQKRYLFDMKSFTLEISETEDYSASCQESELITDMEAFRLMSDHLKENGYDTTSLQAQNITILDTGK